MMVGAGMSGYIISPVVKIMDIHVFIRISMKNVSNLWQIMVEDLAVGLSLLPNPDSSNGVTHRSRQTGVPVRYITIR